MSTPEHVRRLMALGHYSAGVFITSDRWGNTNFRPPYGTARRPVKGGRWKVRKLKFGRGWRAWTEGTNKKYNRTFSTHAEAVEWANAHAGTNFVPGVSRYGRVAE